MPPVNYIGRRFGRITLEAPVAARPSYWRGRCDCGNTVERRLDNLKRSGYPSCGHCRSEPVGSLVSRVNDLECEVKNLRAEIERLRGTTSINVEPVPRNPTGLSSIQTPPMERSLAELSDPEETSTERTKHFPIPDGHFARRKFYYFMGDPEGLELETVWNGEREFIDFCDSVEQVRERIKEYLYDHGSPEQFVESIWAATPGAKSNV